MALFPLTAFRTAMQAAYQTLAQLAQVGHQRDMLSKMLTRTELYDLLGYTAYEARDQAYFGGRRSLEEPSGT
jgi:methylisocitrate lyase